MLTITPHQQHVGNCGLWWSIPSTLAPLKACTCTIHLVIGCHITLHTVSGSGICMAQHTLCLDTLQPWQHKCQSQYYNISQSLSSLPQFPLSSPLMAHLSHSDPTMGQVHLPIVSILFDTPFMLGHKHYLTLNQQCCMQLWPWQCLLFGSLRIAQPTNTFHQKLKSREPILLVSDALVQKIGHSQFAWVIANDAIPLWQGQGLVPGPADDMCSSHMEAFGLLPALLFPAVLHYMLWMPYPDQYSMFLW